MELRVEYHSSPGAYGYQGVPREVFIELTEAESKGGYINRMIKGRYPYDHRPSPLRGGRPKRRRP